MSNFAPENFTSHSAETDSSIEAVASVVHPLLYPNPFNEILAKEDTVTRVECLEGRGESIDEEEVINVVRGGDVGARNGAESGIRTVHLRGRTETRQFDCCVRP